MEEKRNQEKKTVYIRLNKQFCYQTKSRYENKPIYYVMTLPPGTVVEGLNLKGGKINPPVMFEDRKNPNMFCAPFDVSKLKDGAIDVYMGENAPEKYISIDAEKLRAAIAAANHSYYEEKKRQRDADLDNQYRDMQKKNEVSQEIRPGFKLVHDAQYEV